MRATTAANACRKRRGNGRNGGHSGAADREGRGGSGGGFLTTGIKAMQNV